MSSKEKQEAGNNLGKRLHIICRSTQYHVANLGYSKTAIQQNRLKSGIEVGLRMVSNSYLFPGFNLPGLDINNMVSVNNTVCS